MTPTFYWEGICAGDPVSAIQKIQESISRFGFITDFYRYSDITLVLSIDVAPKQISGLFTALSSVMHLTGNSNEEITSGTDCLVRLNITFVRSTGDKRNEIPMVPG